MKVVFIERAWSEYQYWQENDKRMVRKVNSLLRDIIRHPYSGLGKPETLKHDLAGLWSRRIDHEHRLVYRADDEELIVYSCRFHYDN
jgi:toxin YoeB